MMNKQNRKHIEKAADILCMRSSELGKECIEVMLETIFNKGMDYAVNMLEEMKRKKGI